MNFVGRSLLFLLILVFADHAVANDAAQCRAPIKISPADASCKADADCTTVSKHCGQCDACGVPVGRQAETAAQFLRKGSSILAEGRMQTRSWDGTDGQKKYRTEIVADRIQFGPRPAGAGPASAPAPKAPAAMPEESAGDSIEYPEENINIDDIPF